MSDPHYRTVEQWTTIINAICKHFPGSIKLRGTDHEYRVDDRDVVMWNGHECNFSIDGLPYNILRDQEFIAWALDTYELIN